MRVPLVPAYSACTAPNRTHGPPLAFPSCNPPAQASPHLTVGTPGRERGGARTPSGSVKLTPLPGRPPRPPTRPTCSIAVSITDVRSGPPDLTDYTGQLQLDVTLRITDRLNGSSPVDRGRCPTCRSR